MVALASIFIVLEPVRIFMGFTGNLKERVPDLCGSFMLSTFPQLPILLYFCGLQSLTASGFTLPFEFALNFVYALVLIPQILIGYRAAKHIVDIQAARFVVGVGELRSGFDDIALAAEPDHGKAKAE
ncbi:uncharacterized protein BJ171DRAFT_460367 [Polychytrium aggregatum]|uniref:uncharacterized protein n=1 Tax=Polychytrium aggregatum TaxID=110093 RepID=UPI0022FE6A4E|nr:uncharacterized protein BJ171DRAFT_460367 [Polychytrium aggregatum]KAI9203532.1 hypothetical protein BJ171DRAFT_460367 [Polychytrium aggregatum]